MEDEGNAYPKRRLPGFKKARIVRGGSLSQALNGPVQAYQNGELPGGDRTLSKAIGYILSIRRKEGEDRATAAAEAKIFMDRAKLHARAFRIAYNKLKKKVRSPEQRIRDAEKAIARRMGKAKKISTAAPSDMDLIEF